MLGRMRYAGQRRRHPWRAYSGSRIHLLDGLLAYYRFQDDLLDSSGNGRDMTGTATFSSGGIIGNCLSDEAAEITGLSVSLTDFSTSFWVFFTGLASGDASLFIDKTGDTVLGIVCDRGSRVVTVSPLGGTPIATSALATGAWRHIAVVCSGGTLRLYLDASLVGATDAPDPATVVGWSIVATTSNTKVRLDEWSLASRAWFPLEVAALYNGGIGRDPTA